MKQDTNLKVVHVYYYDNDIDDKLDKEIEKLMSKKFELIATGYDFNTQKRELVFDKKETK